MERARRRNAENIAAVSKHHDLDWKSRCLHASLPVLFAASNLSHQLRTRRIVVALVSGLRNAVRLILAVSLAGARSACRHRKSIENTAMFAVNILYCEIARGITDLAVRMAAACSRAASAGRMWTFTPSRVRPESIARPNAAYVGDSGTIPRLCLRFLACGVARVFSVGNPMPITMSIGSNIAVARAWARLRRDTARIAYP